MRNLCFSTVRFFFLKEEGPGEGGKVRLGTMKEKTRKSGKKTGIKQKKTDMGQIICVE